jgi:hypothetical protein
VSVPAGCADVLVSSIPFSHFAQRANDIYSSPFLRSVAPPPYDIVENSHHVRIAQIRGNALVVELGSAIIGPIQLCVDIQQGTLRCSLRSTDWFKGVLLGRRSPNAVGLQHLGLCHHVRSFYYCCVVLPFTVIRPERVRSNSQ